MDEVPLSLAEHEQTPRKEASTLIIVGILASYLWHRPRGRGRTRSRRRAHRYSGAISTITNSYGG